MTAYRQGLFQKYGVTVNQPVFVGGTPRLGAALVGGTFQAAGVGFAAAVGADASGADLESVAALGKYANFALVLPPGSPIKSARDLKGKTIALSQIGDTADGFLTTLLEKNGLNRATDVKVTQAGSSPNALGQALARKVDAASVGASDSFIGRTKGATILATSRDVNQLQPQGSFQMRRSWAQAHKPEVLGLLKGMLGALALYRSSEEEGIKELKDSGWFKDVPDDVLKLIYEDDLGSWSEIPFVDRDAAMAVIDLTAKQNPAAAKVDPSMVIDNSYLQELVSSGFVKTLFPNYKG